jgi:hypothetical protein
LNTQEKIGKILCNSEEERDAIHIAVFPAIAGHDLIPGTGVKLGRGTINVATRAADKSQSIGIVDPFLSQPVQKGERFWIFIHPNTVTGMRHEWEHPELDGSDIPTSESEKWIREFAAEWNFDLYQLIERAQTGNDYIVAVGRDLHSSSELGPDHDLFWFHLENLTGRKFDERHRENHRWSCSC